MTVHKVTIRGRQRWRARVSFGGRIRTRLCDRRDDARKAEQTLIAELKAEAERKANPPAPTFRDFVPRFLDHQATENRGSWMGTQRQIIDDYLLPSFGDLQLDAITVELVDAYKAVRLKHLAHNTVANHVTVIKRALNVAREWSLLDHAPRLRQVKRPRTEFDYLTIEEADRYLDAAGPWRLFVLVAMRTGLRLGELRGLQWGDIEFRT